MKLSDYVSHFLAEQGVKHIFGLTGGAIVHLFDSAAKNLSLTPIFTHHEQSAAMAAEAYARITNNLGACFVTTGPGGTNAITGVAGAWLDSVPCIYISGQARFLHTTQGKGIRQLGTQQLDIVPIVTPITKYAAMVNDPKLIRYYLEKAVYIAKTGRPGPVWIDLPLDFQWAEVDPGKLPSFNASEWPTETPSLPLLKDRVQNCIQLIRKAKRALFLAGYGIRLAHAEKEFREFIETLEFPFVSSWNASDLLPTDSPFYVGRPGIFGQRGANLAVQNCDLLISIGSHLAIPITGTTPTAFAREAKKVIVDIDAAELSHRFIPIDLAIQCDAKKFLQEVTGCMEKLKGHDINSWRLKCLSYKTRYNGVQSKCLNGREPIDPYDFIDILSDLLDSNDTIVVDGGGTINQITFQTFRVKEGQRLIISAGLCPMGSGLPESIGACFANGRKRTVCLCGDGSIQLNIQELQTIVHHDLPVKIFVFNNDGYLSIRHTQDGFLESRYVGSDKQGGLSAPDVTKVAQAYGLKTARLSSLESLEEKIREALDSPGPFLCEVEVPRDQPVVPRQGFDRSPDGAYLARPLEDMYPFLDRAEFLQNMIVKPLPESK